MKFSILCQKIRKTKIITVIQPRDRTQVFHIAGRFIYQLSHKGSLRILEWVAYPFFKGSSNPGIKLGSPALQADSLSTELSGSYFVMTALGNLHTR